jgi:hypothetical protein
MWPARKDTRIRRQRGRWSLTEEFWSRASIPLRVAARSMLAASARPGRSAAGPVHRASARDRLPSCFASPFASPRSRPRSPAGLTLSILGKYLRRLRVLVGRIIEIQSSRALALYHNDQARNLHINGASQGDHYQCLPGHTTTAAAEVGPPRYRYTLR